MTLTRFVNRSRCEFHLNILRALQEKGPCPTTVLAYRSEMNDSQVQEFIDFLEERKMVQRSPLTNKIRAKLPEQYSASSKNIVSITNKGVEYLMKLKRLDDQIDWTLRANEIVKRRQQ